MHLRQVAQRAENLDRAIEFYGEVLGLDKIARFDPPGLAFFDLGGTRLLLESGAPSALGPRRTVACGLGRWLESTMTKQKHLKALIRSRQTRTFLEAQPRRHP